MVCVSVAIPAIGLRGAARCRGELHATFVDSSPGGGRALPLVALLVAQPLTQPLAPPVAQLVGLAVAVGLWWLKWRGTARRVAVPSLGFCCVVAVSYSPTTYRLQYHWRCRA